MPFQGGGAEEARILSSPLILVHNWSGAQQAQGSTGAGVKSRAARVRGAECNQERVSLGANARAGPKQCQSRAAGVQSEERLSCESKPFPSQPLALVILQSHRVHRAPAWAASLLPELHFDIVSKIQGNRRAVLMGAMLQWAGLMDGRRTPGDSPAGIWSGVICLLKDWALPRTREG